MAEPEKATHGEDQPTHNATFVSSKHFSGAAVACAFVLQIGLCFVGPISLYAVAMFMNALGEKQKPRWVIFYAALTCLLWGNYCGLFLIPLFWLLGLELWRASCWGLVLGSMVWTSIVMRPDPAKPLPGTRIPIRIWWDWPQLLIGYLIDTTLVPALGAFPYFHDGRGVFISDITDNLCMGGRPLSRHVPNLLEHGVHSVLNFQGYWEWFPPTRAYKAAGIETLRLPTLDTTSPRAEDLRRGLEFVGRRLEEKGGQGRVYIHCKGGRGRAGAMMLCCLVKTNGMTVQEAFALMKRKRPCCENAATKYRDVLTFIEGGGDSHDKETPLLTAIVR